MARTSSTVVQTLLAGNYGPQGASLQPPIDTAANLVDKIAAADSGGQLDDSSLELIERYLAAHFYGHLDQMLQSKSTGGAGGSFMGRTDLGFDGTLYGQTAKRLDVTGYLVNLDLAQRPKAAFTWLGRPPSRQTPYLDRD